MSAVPRWRAAVASPDAYGLGEGPIWDPPRRRALWVDIDAGTVHEGRLDADRVVPSRSWRLDDTVGAVACSAAGDLLVAGARTLITVPATGSEAGPLPGPPLVPPGARRRLNDGGCDPAGRFLVGTLAMDDSRGGETLVRLEPDGSSTVLDEDLTVSNGLAWSPGGDLFYNVDSVPGIVWTRSYDVTTGACGSRREFLSFPDDTPDGMSADAEGHLWIAFWGAGQVRRYAPDGRLAGIVDVPAPHTTSVAFVGDGLDQLLITTATVGLGPDRLAAYPDSGRLFLARVGVAGLPATAWAGPGPGPATA